MPRLLLVDDNPSIHRIAESLLAPTDVELVCVDSAAEALDRFERGEHFDVALVDTVMPGMDGWTLLARLREMDATARLPIALMAGVLDPVDPARLAKAPIQGFLKKPIELRELGDRVRALLASPIAAAEPPAAVIAAPVAQAATPAMDLARTAEMPMPEFRLDVPSADDSEALPPLDLGPDLDLPEPGPSGADEDLLLLTAEDLWPEDVPAEAAPAVLSSAASDVHLELEELDLESLHELTSEAAPSEPPPVHPVLAAPPELPPMEAAAPEAEALAAESLASFTDLESFEDLGGGLDLPSLPEPPPAETPTMLPVAGLAAAGLAAAAIPMLERHLEPPPAPVVEAPVIPAPAPALEHLEAVPAESPIVSTVETPVPAASGQAVAALGQASLTPDQIQALLADPALLDALVKAVVARMGDQVVREIAWEVMPDLAGRLQR
jgi:CheY-like chemotaxis protein